LLPLKDAVTLFFCSPGERLLVAAFFLSKQPTLLNFAQLLLLPHTVIATVLEFVVQGDSLNVLTGGGILSTVLGVFLVTKPDCIQHLVIHNNSHTLGEETWPGK
jgi:hypothetical protein